MLRTALYLSISFAVLDSTALAQGSTCLSKKSLGTEKTDQSTSLRPMTVSAPSVTVSQVPTPRPSTSMAVIPSPAINVEPGVETPYLDTRTETSSPSVPIFKMAEAPAKVDKTEKSEPMTSSLHAPWNDILQSYVSAPDEMGLTHFDYARLKSSSEDKLKLDRYIKSLEAKDPSALSENEAIAFWANLYNAVTIQVVTDNYPVKSIRKLGSFNSGPWKKNLVTVNGAEMSLDDIEHGTLRKKYPSPYIHYMVNCASVGCPNLLNEAWEADSLRVKRKAAAADYINSPRGAVASGDKLTVSSIYDWFEEDFGGSKEGVIEHIRKYATGDLADAINSGAKIKKYDYDWSLNN